MSALINIFFEICLLKKGPQDVPASRFLFQLVLLAYVSLNAIMLMLLEDDFVYSLVAIVVDLFLVVGLIKLVLIFANMPDRFLKTISAVLGTTIVMSIGMMMAQVWYDSVESEAAKEFPGFLALVIFGWNIVVIGHILKNALDTFLSIGILLAVVYILVQASVLSYIQDVFFTA